MNYKEYLDEVFAPYKKTKKTRDLYDKILKKTKFRYMSLINDGYGNHSATEKILQELQNVKSQYHQFHTLPRVDKEGIKMYKWTSIIGTIILAATSVLLFINFPLAGPIPLIIISIIAFMVVSSIPRSESIRLRYIVLPSLFTGLLLFQNIMFFVAYGVALEEEVYGLFIGFGLIFIVAVPLMYWLPRLQLKKTEEQHWAYNLFFYRWFDTTEPIVFITYLTSAFITYILFFILIIMNELLGSI